MNEDAASEPFSEEERAQLLKASTIFPRGCDLHPLLLPFDTTVEEAFNARYRREHLRGAFMLAMTGVVMALLRFVRLLVDQNIPGDTKPGEDPHYLNLAANAVLLLGGVTIALWTGIAIQPPAWLAELPSKYAFGITSFAAFATCMTSIATILVRDTVQVEWAIIIGQILPTFPLGCALLVGLPFWISTLMMIAGFIACAASPHTGGSKTE